MASWDGFQSATIPANRYQQMFINGYLDVSGRTIIRNGDLSLNSGRLFVSGDASLNSKLFVANDTSFNGNVQMNKNTVMNGNLIVRYDTSMNGNVQIGGNLIVQGNLSALRIQNKNITNVSTTNYQLIVSEDISLNGRLFVSGNVGIGSGAPLYGLDVLTTAGNAPLNVKVGTTNALSVNSSGFVGIWTATPTVALDVSGDVKLQKNSFATTISPNSSAASTNNWSTTVNGQVINWSSSASSVFPNSAYAAYKPFDTVVSSWASTNAANLYSVTTGNYPTTGPSNTLNINNISGVSSLSGEWLQIYTGGIPLILSNYKLGVGGATQFPKEYYILGSNDNKNWYGIHKGSLSAVPTASNSIINTEILQQGTLYSSYGGTGTLTINVYSGAPNLYRYFRIVITTIFSTTGGNVAELSEWNINFTTAATSSGTLSLDGLTQNQLNVSSGATFAAYVGIGTGTPSYGLDVLTTAGNSPLNVTVGTNNALSVISSGYVGIGTTNPVTFLDVRKEIGGGSGAVFRGSADDAGSKSIMSLVDNHCSLPMSMSASNMYFYGRFQGSNNYRYVIASSAYFTGQHANYPIDQNLKTNIVNYIGLLVSSADQGYYSRNQITNEIITGKKAITITECLPKIILTSRDKDPAVWGIITNVKNDDINTDGTIPTDDKPEFGDRLSSDVIRINGVGEGGIWVTNINGNIINGDFICSSIIPGYGRKQDDDLFHNYTAAKATMSCDFDIDNNDLYECKEIECNGTIYLAAFIGVVYHCS